jgi:hypothetical protein
MKPSEVLNRPMSCRLVCFIEHKYLLRDDLITREDSFLHSVQSQPEVEPQPARHNISLPPQHKWSVLAFLIVILVLLVIFAGAFVDALMQAATPTARTGLQLRSVFQGRNRTVLPAMDLPLHRTILYEQRGNIYSYTTPATQASEQDHSKQATPGAVPRPVQIQTPGYEYRRALSPVVTSERQLLYAGAGLWMNDLEHNQPSQLVRLDETQEVTSLVLSRDGSQLAWSSAPKDGHGMIQIFAGPVKATKLVYQQQAGQCPCFRVFGFLPADGLAGHTTLLLTNDQGDNGPIQHGLWFLSLMGEALARPVQVIASDPPQGPLALSPRDATLLYTTYNGNVAVPGGLSADLATVEYANSLVVADVQKHSPYLKNAQVVLAAQNEQRSTALYHWVTTPEFSSDGQMLTYVVFSAEGQGSFTRTNALYVVDMHASASLGRPLLLATTPARYVELGSWWDANTVTVFVDNALYALDMRHARVAKILQTDSYVRTVAVLG